LRDELRDTGNGHLRIMLSFSEEDCNNQKRSSATSPLPVQYDVVLSQTLVYESLDQPEANPTPASFINLLH
jgi:hypothetical protein